MKISCLIAIIAALSFGFSSCYDAPCSLAIAPISLQRGKSYSVQYTAGDEFGTSGTMDKITYTAANGRLQTITGVGLPWNLSVTVSGDSANEIQLTADGNTYRANLQISAAVRDSTNVRTASDNCAH